MPAGIEVINNWGTVLIDSNDPSLCLHTKATASSDGSRVLAYTFHGVEFPTLALRSTAGKVSIIGSSVSGTSITYTLLTENAAQSVDMYLFDRPISSGSTYGLQVFDAAGRLTFDALRSPGRVVDVLGDLGTYTGTSGRIYAGIVSPLLQGQYFLNVDYDNPPGVPNPTIQFWDRYATCAGVSASGHTLTLGQMTRQAFIREVPPLPWYVTPAEETPDGTCIVLDVTGY